MTTPKEKPILMSAPMVRALLEGRKTQTRRIITPDNSTVNGWRAYKGDDVKVNGAWKALDFDAPYPSCMVDEGFPDADGNKTYHYLHVPQVKGDVGTRHRVRSRIDVGDRLWVRETFRKFGDGYLYRADKEIIGLDWKPSIFMPRTACRLTMDETKVRPERLQDISDADAVAEGVYFGYDLKGQTIYDASPRWLYEALWNTINGKGAWAQNPWVWVYEWDEVKRSHA